MPSLRILPMFYIKQRSTIKIKEKKKTLKIIAEVKHKHNVARLPLKMDQ